MKKLFKSATFSTWIFSGSKLVVLLVLTSLIIKKFNVGEIALWYLFGSIQAFAHLFDIGFSTTIIRFTAYNSASEDENEFRNGFQELYSSMNMVYFFLMCVVVLVLIVVGFFSVWPLVQENTIYRGMFSYAFIIIILPLNFFLKKNDAFIKGLNEVSLYNNWNAIMYFVSGIVTVIFLFFDYPFYVVLLVSQLGLFFNSIKNVFLLKGILSFPIDMFGFSYNKEIINHYWKPTWKSALVSFSSNGVNNLTNVLIPNFFSIEIIASYLFSMRLIQFVNEFSWAPFYSQIPKYIKKFKIGEKDKLAQNICSRLNWSLILVIVGVFSLGISANFLLPYFDTKTNFIKPSLVGFIMIMFVFERFTAMHAQIRMFSNDIEHYKQYLLLSVIYIILLVILLKPIGLYAIAVAYILAALFPVYIISKKSLSLLGISFKEYWNRYLYKIVIISSVFFIILMSL